MVGHEVVLAYSHRVVGMDFEKLVVLFLKLTCGLLRLPQGDQDLLLAPQTFLTDRNLGFAHLGRVIARI